MTTVAIVEDVVRVVMRNSPRSLYAFPDGIAAKIAGEAPLDAKLPELLTYISGRLKVYRLTPKPQATGLISRLRAWRAA